MTTVGGRHGRVQRTAEYVSRLVLRGLVEGLARTWRFEVRGWHHVAGLRARRTPAVYVVWHRLLLPLTFRHRAQGVSVLVSQHRDGGYLAFAAERWGYRVVRGSSRRGGHVALLNLVRALKGGSEVAMTPDGPRGPAQRVQPGAVAAAQHAGVPLVAVGLRVDRSWRMASWDRFVIPKPFATISIEYGAPLTVPPGRRGLDDGVRAAQRALDRVSPAA